MFGEQAAKVVSALPPLIWALLAAFVVWILRTPLFAAIGRLTTVEAFSVKLALSGSQAMNAAIEMARKNPQWNVAIPAADVQRALDRASARWSARPPKTKFPPHQTRPPAAAPNTAAPAIATDNSSRLAQPAAAHITPAAATQPWAAPCSTSALLRRRHAADTKPSTRTLRGRLGDHFRGNAEGSTSRLTLGCLLADKPGPYS